MSTCPVETLAILLGKKWIPQIIEILSIEPTRFSLLHKNLTNSSPKMLRQQLNILEQQGIVYNEKKICNNRITSTYILTKKGVELSKIVKIMKKYGEKELDC
jgi:DNA-binding HxlR family transcriptional regulator